MVMDGRRGGGRGGCWWWLWMGDRRWWGVELYDDGCGGLFGVLSVRDLGLVGA